MRTLLLVTAVTCVVLGGCARVGSVSTRPASHAEIAALEARAIRDSTNVELQLRLASAYLSQERPGDALPPAERALESGGPTIPRAALLLGLAHEDLGDYRQAREYYNRALRLPGASRLRSQLRKRLVLLQQRETQAYVREALAREAELANTPPRPRTVAVFPLGVPAPDSITGPLGYALTAMLITDLSQTDRLTVLERAVVQALLAEIQLGASGRVDERTAARGGRLLGAERIVQGSVVSADDELTLDAAVVRLGGTREAAPTGGGTVSERGRLARLFEMEKSLALKLYAALGIELTPAERAEVTKVRTENLQALIAYGRGLQASDAGDPAAALRFFSEANHLDPGFALAREQVATTQAVVAATSVTTQQLAAGASQLAGMATTAWSKVLPFTTMMRDAVAELLGTEGLSIETAIDYFKSSPGGSQ